MLEEEGGMELVRMVYVSTSVILSRGEMRVTRLVILINRQEFCSQLKRWHSVNAAADICSLLSHHPSKNKVVAVIHKKITANALIKQIPKCKFLLEIHWLFITFWQMCSAWLPSLEALPQSECLNYSNKNYAVGCKWLLTDLPTISQRRGPFCDFLVMLVLHELFYEAAAASCAKNIRSKNM